MSIYQNLSHYCSLDSIPCHSEYIIDTLYTKGTMRRRLLDLGFIPGAAIHSVFSSPGGYTTAYCICDTLIALRKETAKEIIVRPKEQKGTSYGD